MSEDGQRNADHDQSLALIASTNEDLHHLTEELEGIRNVNHPDNGDNLIGSVYMDQHGERSWGFRMAGVLLMMTSVELYSNLDSLVEEFIQNTETDNRGARYRISKLNQFRQKNIEPELQARRNVILDDLDELCRLHEPYPISFGVRKEIVPFNLYYTTEMAARNRTRTPRMHDFLIMPQGNVKTRPLLIVNRNNNEYLRYIIEKEETHSNKPFIFFRKVKYHKCAFDRELCTRLQHLCGGCKAVSYCSRQCQRNHRDVHTREVCNSLRLQYEEMKERGLDDVWCFREETSTSISNEPADM